MSAASACFTVSMPSDVLASCAALASRPPALASDEAAAARSRPPPPPALPSATAALCALIRIAFWMRTINMKHSQRCCRLNSTTSGEGREIKSERKFSRSMRPCFSSTPKIRPTSTAGGKEVFGFDQSLGLFSSTCGIECLAIIDDLVGLLLDGRVVLRRYTKNAASSSSKSGFSSASSSPPSLVYAKIVCFRALKCSRGFDGKNSRRMALSSARPSMAGGWPSALRSSPSPASAAAFQCGGRKRSVRAVSVAIKQIIMEVWSW
mmetsp:Transcript_8207/g.20668  ORF Transcript_8207/g.20668 Transcript_8207/m.20668 type:complete len:264 (-) Transcript_8207:2694-3485(-)